MVVMRNKATEKLLALAAQHPELPIEALVDSEVVADDDFNTWLGDVFDVSIEEIWADPDGKTWTRTEAEGDLFDFADESSEYLGEHHDNYEQMLDMDDKEAEKVITEWINEIHWKKYIVLHVDTPDSLTEGGRKNGHVEDAHRVLHKNAMR